MSDMASWRTPFGVTPNPRYLYHSKTHAEARASLIIGIECGVGFQALIAPPGMGKTSILLDVLERFNKVARTTFLSQIQGDCRDFLGYLIAELGEKTHNSVLMHMQDIINELDGALVDLFRIRISRFRQDRILVDLFRHDPGLVDVLQKVKRSLDVGRLI